MNKKEIKIGNGPFLYEEISKEQGHHWMGEIDPENAMGFIYVIINTKDYRSYIGKKQYWAIRRQKVKGRVNRRVIKKPNDWEFYTGSSKELNGDIEKYGRSYFLFIILENFKTKGGLHYGEVDLQNTLHVLTEKLKGGDRAYYNKHIGGCKFLPKEALEDDHRDAIKKALNKRKLIEYDGKSLYINEWAKELGIKANTLVCRLRRGWTVQEALESNREKKLYNGKLTESEIFLIKTELENGKSTIEIGKELNIDSSQVWRVADKFGFKKKNLKEQRVRLANELFDSGKSQKEIANILKCSQSTVSNYLREKERNERKD